MTVTATGTAPATTAAQAKTDKPETALDKKIKVNSLLEEDLTPYWIAQKARGPPECCAKRALRREVDLSCVS